MADSRSTDRGETATGRLTRRHVLSMSSGVLFSAALHAEQTPVDRQGRARVNPGQPGARGIDVHHHFVPPGYLDAMAGTTAAGLQGDWTPQRSLDAMDKYGVETAVVSISLGVETVDPAQTSRLCRDCGEYGAKLVTQHPRRFGLFAPLPLPDVDASLKELSYALDVLKADGIGLSSHYGKGMYLGDPTFDPVMEEMNRRKVVTFVHPRFLRLGLAQSPGSRYINVADIPSESTRAIFNLLGQGTTERYPDIKFIWPHGGGTSVFMLSRLAWSLSGQGDFASVYARLKKAMSSFYFDLALTVSPSTIKAIHEIAPASHVLLGSDYPYAGDPARSMGQVLGQLSHIGLSDADLLGVVRQNAQSLFPRLTRPTQ